MSTQLVSLFNAFRGGIKETEMCTLLACRHPEIFLRLHAETQAAQHHRDVIRLLAMGPDYSVIGAIKALRIGEGLGLKESKDLVDALRATMESIPISEFAQPTVSRYPEIFEALKLTWQLSQA